MNRESLENLICRICQDYFSKTVTLSCGHCFCSKCITIWRKGHNNRCPLCRAMIQYASPCINMDNLIKENHLERSSPEDESDYADLLATPTNPMQRELEAEFQFFQGYVLRDRHHPHHHHTFPMGPTPQEGAEGPTPTHAHFGDWHNINTAPHLPFFSRVYPTTEHPSAHVTAEDTMEMQMNMARPIAMEDRVEGWHWRLPSPNEATGVSVSPGDSELFHVSADSNIELASIQASIQADLINLEAVVFTHNDAAQACAAVPEAVPEAVPDA